MTEVQKLLEEYRYTYLREEADSLSREEFAKNLGLDESLLGKLLGGQRLATPQAIHKIVTALQLDAKAEARWFAAAQKDRAEAFAREYQTQRAGWQANSALAKAANGRPRNRSVA